MKTDEIKLLYEYNFWANHRILTTCAKISPELYAAPTNSGNGYRSLRATVVHLVDSESQWRLMRTGFYKEHLTDAVYRSTELNEAQFPTLRSIEERWQMEEREMRDYLSTLTDEQVNGVFRYTLENGTVRERILWHNLIDVVNHATTHRSEAAAMLTSYGQSPGEFQLTLFLNEYFKLPS
jgi:uncharacterized damage-inducible protein DinB